MDFSLLMQSAPQMFRDLPFLINMAQLIFYSGLALTFGGLVMNGYKGHMSGPALVVGRLVFGFLAVVTGLGIAWLIPVFSDVPIYMIMQTVFLNAIPGGLIATAVLYGSLKMISYNIFNLPGIEKGIKSLKELKKKAKDAEASDKKHGRHGIRHPVRIAGLALFLGFLVFGLSGFSGFPDPVKEMGFSGDGLENMAGQLEDINEQYGDRISDMMSDTGTMEECMGAVNVMNDEEAMSEASTYVNPQVKGMMEDYTNETVITMLGIESGSGFYVFAMTQSQTCIGTLNTVCACEDMDSA